MKTNSLDKRIRVLEQQATVKRTINAYSKVNESLAEWVMLERSVTPEEALTLAEDFRTKPLDPNSPEMQQFANSSGYPAETCCSILSEVLCLTFQVLYYGKSPLSGTKTSE